MVPRSLGVHCKSLRSASINNDTNDTYKDHIPAIASPTSMVAQAGNSSDNVDEAFSGALGLTNNNPTPDHHRRPPSVL